MQLTSKANRECEGDGNFFIVDLISCKFLDSHYLKKNVHKINFFKECYCIVLKFNGRVYRVLHFGYNIGTYFEVDDFNYVTKVP